MYGQINVFENQLSLICPRCGNNHRETKFDFPADHPDIWKLARQHVKKNYKYLIYVDDSGKEQIDMVCDYCKYKQHLASGSKETFMTWQ